ncbi:hypothetical protein CANCADRAFT_58575 [Tortispora caseinolytica NRRL Y-17796]|uniref:Uncharacterized protein n=1 Tax=Tortispora caseinolytica NRRL Y-17796 TaxID=767744 RepID=A0A1E4TD75_9ASCO|nr:hypothetical protein CANCADRAFT_58575 [Tortispora caseinolytica NRRL Y-17796]
MSQIGDLCDKYFCPVPKEQKHKCYLSAEAVAVLPELVALVETSPSAAVHVAARISANLRPKMNSSRKYGAIYLLEVLLHNRNEQFENSLKFTETAKWLYVIIKLPEFRPLRLLAQDVIRKYAETSGKSFDENTGKAFGIEIPPYPFTSQAVRKNTATADDTNMAVGGASPGSPESPSSAIVSPASPKSPSSPKPVDSSDSPKPVGTPLLPVSRAAIASFVSNLTGMSGSLMPGKSNQFVGTTEAPDLTPAIAEDSDERSSSTSSSSSSSSTSSTSTSSSSSSSSRHSVASENRIETSERLSAVDAIKKVLEYVKQYVVDTFKSFLRFDLFQAIFTTIRSFLHLGFWTAKKVVRMRTVVERDTELTFRNQLALVLVAYDRAVMIRMLRSTSIYNQTTQFRKDPALETTATETKETDSKNKPKKKEKEIEENKGTVESDILLAGLYDDQISAWPYIEQPKYLRMKLQALHRETVLTIEILVQILDTNTANHVYWSEDCQVLVDRCRALVTRTSLYMLTHNTQKWSPDLVQRIESDLDDLLKILDRYHNTVQHLESY